MTKYTLFLAITVFMICGIAAGLIENPKSIEAQERISSRDSEEHVAFQQIRNELEEKRVPFDPEILLDPTGLDAVRHFADQIPEMREKRVLGRSVRGVQMAETLFLPEKIELTGDTLLLARRIVFEGNNVVIEGNHNIYFMPLEKDGALGMSLKSAMQADLGRQASPDRPEQLRRFEPKLIQAGYSLTIDASGLTYDEWLQMKASESLLNPSLSSEEDTCPPNAGCSPTPNNHPPPAAEGSPVPPLETDPDPVFPTTAPFDCISNRTRGADGLQGNEGLQPTGGLGGIGIPVGNTGAEGNGG